MEQSRLISLFSSASGKFALDRDSNYDAGCSLVRKLRFLEKLEEEIDEALE